MKKDLEILEFWNNGDYGMLSVSERLRLCDIININFVP
jgi:hypothetical protein